MEPKLDIPQIVYWQALKMHCPMCVCQVLREVEAGVAKLPPPGGDGRPVRPRPRHAASDSVSVSRRVGEEDAHARVLRGVWCEFGSASRAMLGLPSLTTSRNAARRPLKW